MKFPIDTNNMMVLVAEPPAQRRDFDTKAPKVTDDGKPVFQLRVLMMDGAESTPMRVTVHGDPGVMAMQPVKLHGLAINVMDRKGDTMMWATAERVEAVGPPLAPAEGNGSANASANGSADAPGSGRTARKADG